MLMPSFQIVDTPFLLELKWPIAILFLLYEKTKEIAFIYFCEMIIIMVEH